MVRIDPYAVIKGWKLAISTTSSVMQFQEYAGIEIVMKSIT